MAASPCAKPDIELYVVGRLEGLGVRRDDIGARNPPTERRVGVPIVELCELLVLVLGVELSRGRHFGHAADADVERQPDITLRAEGGRHE